MEINPNVSYKILKTFVDSPLPLLTINDFEEAGFSDNNELVGHLLDLVDKDFVITERSTYRISPKGRICFSDKNGPSSMGLMFGE